MADDRIQRPIRASQPPMRTAPSSSPAGSSGNDPLAELARLIGQSDPFGEYDRQNVRRAAQQPAPAPQAAAYADDRYAVAPEPAPQHADFAADDHRFDNHQQQYGAAPPPYQARAAVPGYPPEAGEHEAEYATNAHSAAEDHDFYDDVPPRRRMGILAIAAVFALAVIGTAGAFGYRAIFGSSGSKAPPPVIKADSSPTKIVPAAQSKDPKSGKLIYDRVADRSQDEKLVSREEQPVDMNKPSATPASPGQNAGSIPAPTGSGVVATEPKKVHTIAIRPDGTVMADAAPTPVAAPTPLPAPVAAPAPPASNAPRAPAAAEPPPRQTVAHAEPPKRAPAPPSSNAPLSLSPDAAPEAPTARPARTAAVAPPTQIAPQPAAAPARPAPTSAAPASGGGSGYAVQVSSQRSEADAQAAFRSLQAKYPGQLGGKRAMIHRVDLGAKGIYYRAMVGPLDSQEASQLCSSLKAAGGQCIVQKI